MIIDVHGHITHPELLARFPMPKSLGDVKGMLDNKSEAGIGLTIVGSPVGFGVMTPIPGHNNYRQGLDALKSFHEWMAKTVQSNYDRLRAYVYVNPHGADEEIALAESFLSERGFVGLIINSSIEGEYLDKRADRVFDMAGRLGVPIFVHPPAEPIGWQAFSNLRLVEQIGRFSDVGNGLAALIFRGTLERHPDVNVIGATGGGSLSMLIRRVEAAREMQQWGASAAGGPVKGPVSRRDGGPSSGDGPADRQAGVHAIAGNPGTASTAQEVGIAPIAESLSRIWVDTAGGSKGSLSINSEVLGVGRILFGTDSPPLPTALPQLVSEITSVCGGSAGAVLKGNAISLFGERLDIREELVA